MLYYVAISLLIAWFILKFLMDKSGFIHTFLLAAIGCFVVQFVQHLRTRQYERDRRNL